MTTAMTKSGSELYCSSSLEWMEKATKLKLDVYIRVIGADFNLVKKSESKRHVS